MVFAFDEGEVVCRFRSVAVGVGVGVVVDAAVVAVAVAVIVVSPAPSCSFPPSGLCVFSSSSFPGSFSVLLSSGVPSKSSPSTDSSSSFS